jgi:uncharacterized protein YacL
MSLWAVRFVFVVLSTLAGYAVSQVRPELLNNGLLGAMVGFGFAGVLVAFDELIKGFSLRAFSAATVGLFLGFVMAILVDRSGLFDYVDERPRWIIRLGLFVGLSYIGMILAMRSNKEDFYLVIPFVRFAPQDKSEDMLVLDTSVIIDGRIADLVEAGFVAGTLVVPRFVLDELRLVGDSPELTRRVRGRRGLDILHRMQKNPRNEVKVHEADFPEEKQVDMKLVRLARVLGAKLYTNDFNLGKVAALHSVPCVNINDLARVLKPVLLPGEILQLRLVREGKEKGQGVGYLNDGTMVVVNQGQALIGQQTEVLVQSLVHTGAGVIVFAEPRPAVATAA